MSWIPQTIRALVFGFGPFAGVARNPSDEIVTAVRGLSFARARVSCITLPVSYSRAILLLNDAQFSKYDVVIGFGAAYGLPGFSVEHAASNVVDAPLPDCDGVTVERRIIDASLPQQLWSTLNTEAITRAVRRAGVPAMESSDAGTYLCNLAFFHVLAETGRGTLAPRAVFVHVPMISEDIAAAVEFIPSLPMPTILAGAVAVLGEVFEQLAPGVVV